MEPISGGNVFAAEAILKSRRRKGRTEYFIKWKGWSSRHNTWEPACNILDNRLIHDFNKRKFKAKAPIKPTKRKQTERQHSESFTKQNEKERAQQQQEHQSSVASTSGCSTNGDGRMVAPLVIKIQAAGLELEDHGSNSSTPPKLSPQGPLSSDSASSGSIWEAEPPRPMRKVLCNNANFNFNNTVLTDITVGNTTVTFVEL